MVYQLLLCSLALIFDVLSACRVAPDEKDLQIALLRQQLRVLERKSRTKARLSRPEKLMLVALTTRLQAQTLRWQQRLRDAVLLVQPETVLKWHRELVRRKWTFRRPNHGGRPRLDPDTEALILRIARENPRMGYEKIQGELLKLCVVVAATTVRNVLRRHRVLPAPQRGKGSWRTFLKHYRQQMLACDFFAVETLRLETLYVLFFIELGSRRVHLAGCATHPDKGWVTQQARQLVWHLDESKIAMRFLMHDRDSKFTITFDSIFASEGIHVIQTPYRSPNANAYAERWVRSAREEFLSKLLIVNETHLRSVMREYMAYHNTARPHQGLTQLTPLPRPPFEPTGNVRRHEVLGGIIGDYYQDTA